MAQEVLDLAGAGPVFGQSGGHGVAQCVHEGALGHPGPDAGGAVCRGDEVLGATTLQATSLAVDEEGRGGARAGLVRTLPIGEWPAQALLPQWPGTARYVGRLCGGLGLGCFGRPDGLNLVTGESPERAITRWDRADNYGWSATR